MLWVTAAAVATAMTNAVTMAVAVVATAGGDCGGDLVYSMAVTGGPYRSAVSRSSLTNK